MTSVKETIKKLIENHHALYRVTDLLPLREPMRKMLRENANALLTYMVGECGEGAIENAEFRIMVLAKIEMLQNTLSAAKDLGYCHPVNFEVLEREYKKISQDIQERALNKKETDFVMVFEKGAPEPIKEGKNEYIEPLIQKQVIQPEQNGTLGFNDRQQAIVDFIKERKTVKSTELATIFSNRFSLKTLQRDLASLIGQKVIDKQGEKRWAVYRMNGFH